MIRKFVFILILTVTVSMTGCGGGGGEAPVSGNAGYNDSDTPGPGPSIPADSDNNPSNPPASNAGDVTKTAELAWQPPVSNADGSPLTDLQGYRVHYGSSSGDYSVTIDVGSVTSYTITNLEPGTYFVAVTAYNAAGSESAYSNEGSKTIL